MIQPTHINLHPNEYSKNFHGYPFAVKLDRYLGSCNTLNDLYNKVCALNKTEDLNLSIEHDYRNVSVRNAMYVKRLCLECCYMYL